MIGLIANIGTIDHQIYRMNMNSYNIFSKLKYTTNSLLNPYCVGDIVSYSTRSCLIFSETTTKNEILVVYNENNKTSVEIINKDYITGILKGYSIKNSDKCLSSLRVERRGRYSYVQLFSKNGKEFFGDVGDEIELKHNVCELDCKRIKMSMEHKRPDIFHDIPEQFVIHGIVDYTAYHFHKPYRNEFFTQRNPYWEQLYHGVHILWDKNMIHGIDRKCYDKLHVGDILIDNDGILHIAAIHNNRAGFYSFKHFQFHLESYYANKGIKLYAINDRMNVIPLVSLLWYYGLSLGAKISICR